MRHSMHTDPTLVTITKRAHKGLVRDRKVLDKMAEANPELFVWASEEVGRDANAPH